MAKLFSSKLMRLVTKVQHGVRISADALCEFSCHFSAIYTVQEISLQSDQVRTPSVPVQLDFLQHVSPSQNTSLLMVLKPPPPPPPPPPDGPQLPGGLLSSEPFGLNEQEDDGACRAWVRAFSSCSCKYSLLSLIMASSSSFCRGGSALSLIPFAITPPFTSWPGNSCLLYMST